MIMLFQEKRIGISNTSLVFTRYQINTKTPSIARPLLFTRKFQKRKETTAAHLLIGCSPETWAWIRCSSGRRRRDSSWKTKFSSSWPGTCQHTPSAATSPARPQSCSGERGRHWDGWRRRSGGEGGRAPKFGIFESTDACVRKILSDSTRHFSSFASLLLS